MSLVITQAIHFSPHTERLSPQTIDIAHVDRWKNRPTFLRLQLLSLHRLGLGPPELHGAVRQQDDTLISLSHTNSLTHT